MEGTRPPVRAVHGRGRFAHPVRRRVQSRGGLYARAPRDARKLRPPQAADQHPLPARSDAGVRPRPVPRRLRKDPGPKAESPEAARGRPRFDGPRANPEFFSERLIFFAKQMILTDQIGPEWTSEDPGARGALRVDDEGPGPPADDRPGRRTASHRPSALTLRREPRDETDLLQRLPVPGRPRPRRAGLLRSRLAPGRMARRSCRRRGDGARPRRRRDEGREVRHRPQTGGVRREGRREGPSARLLHPRSRKGRSSAPTCRTPRPISSSRA